MLHQVDNVMNDQKISYRKLRKYKYQLVETKSFPTRMTGKEGGNSFIRLLLNGELTLQKGYAWDGPSGPAIDTKTFMRASLLHDAFYQLIREGILNKTEDRKLADKIFKEICIEDGMWKFRARYAYLGVRWFGAFAAKPDNTEEIIYQAPT